MLKVLLILLFGLACESAGVILLKKGIMHIGGMNGYAFGEMLRVFKAGITSPQILAGIFFEAVFFGCLMLLMAKTDISFLWPLTGLSFVFATLAAIWFLDEKVSSLRWIGVALIMVGAAFISYSEHAKVKASPDSTTDHTAPTITETMK